MNSTGSPTTDDCREFFTSSYGQNGRQRWRRYPAVLRLLDALYDQRLRLSGALGRCAKWAAGVERQVVLVVGVDAPGRGEELRQVTAELASSRHAVDVTFAPMGQAGKFDNINAVLGGKALSRYDWLLIVDDDITVSSGFLDLLIGEALHRGFKLAQPAHRFLSYASFEVTERHWAAVARRTRFVEIGPVSLFHRDSFADLLPFPSLRWSWGLDVYWAAVARQRGWPIGVIDAVPIRHLRPVGSAYDRAVAIEEGSRFLAARGIALRREDVLTTVELYRR